MEGKPRPPRGLPAPPHRTPTCELLLHQPQLPPAVLLRLLLQLLEGPSEALQLRLLCPQLPAPPRPCH